MKKRVVQRIGFILTFAVLFSIIIFNASAALDNRSVIEIVPNTISNSATDDLVSSNGAFSEEQMNIIALQQPAITAHEEFQENLPWDNELGDYIYPSTFAGAYLEKETFKLCIALTDCSDEVKAEYNKYFSDPSIVTYVQVDFSYNDLLEVKEEIKSTYDDVNYIGIDEEKNVVSVGLSNAEAIQEMSKISTQSQKPIEIFYEEPITLNAKELRGGDAVQSFGYKFTLGICGTYDQKDAILLCGHLLSENDGIYFPNIFNNIATVVQTKFENDKFYDYGIATIRDGANVTLTNKVLNNALYTTITESKPSKPLIGSQVCRYGATTGFAVYSIANNNAEITVDNLETSIKIKGLIACSLGSIGERSKDGDSGGPYYAGHTFYGTHTGGGELYDYFSPIYGVPGFIVKTS